MTQPQARDLCPALGAEITDVDLTTRLDDDTVAFLREKFDDRGVLLFRGAEVARPHVYALCEVLRGQDLPTEEEAAAGAERQAHFYVSNKREKATAPLGSLAWHSDAMWTNEPFEVLSLYAEEVAPPVAPTLFANATRGWETLPPELRARLVGRDAVQVGGPEDLHARRRKNFPDDVMQTVRDNAPAFTFPLVRPHPRTGRMTLVISENHTREIAGLPLDESDDLLDAVFAHLYSPENTYELEWRNHDLVVWDNIATHHARRSVTLEGPTRTLRKQGLPMPTSDALTKVTTFQLAR
jgi:taurine dioxygenase